MAGCAWSDATDCKVDDDCAPEQICASAGGILWGGERVCVTQVGGARDDGGPGDVGSADVGSADVEPPDAADATGGDIDCDGPFDVGGLRFVELAAGKAHTCAVTDSGELYCWGKHHGSIPGVDHDDTPVVWPRPVTPQRRYRSVWAANSVSGFHAHACAIDVDERLYCWGENQQGQVGDGTTEDRPEPTLIEAGFSWTRVFLGTSSSCGLSGDDLYCWGANGSGQLGDGTTEDRHTPEQVASGVQTMAVGAHACTIDDGGQVNCIGANFCGQLGDGTTQQRHTPVAVDDGDFRAREIVTTSGGTTCAVTTDGETYCWGCNDYGMVGDGGAESRSTPTRVLVPSSGELTNLSAGMYHVCGLDPNGKAYCWGGPSAQLLGVGSGDESVPEPAAVQGDRRFVRLESGSGYTCGLGDDDLWYCWGENEGLLGDGTTDHASTPRPIACQ